MERIILDSIHNEKCNETFSNSVSISWRCRTERHETNVPKRYNPVNAQQEEFKIMLHRSFAFRIRIAVPLPRSALFLTCLAFRLQSIFKRGG